MEYNIYVFKTSLQEEADIKQVALLLNQCRWIRAWNIDLEDIDKVLRVECTRLVASDIISMLENCGFMCKELEYLPGEVEAPYKTLKLFFIILLGIMSLSPASRAQVISDSLASDFRTFMAKNFSRYRTVNLYWETKWAHDYNFSLDGQEVEKMRKKNLHTLKASTMIPLLKLRKVSLYANLAYSHYQFDVYDRQTGQSSEVFQQSAYDYYEGGLNGSYYFGLFNKPMIVSAALSVDGWNNGFGMFNGTFSAVSTFPSMPACQW